MEVQVLFFASLCDVAGTRRVALEVEDGATVDEVASQLARTWPALGPRLEKSRVAVNDALVDGRAVLAAGDEVAWLPPVSGGATDDFLAVVDGEISVDRVLAAVRRNDCGAVVLFLGTVRDHFQGMKVLGMEYEAHAALAAQTLADLAREVRARWPIGAMSFVHRVGRLSLGDISVAVAVASPHRAEAFEAGRYAIDRLKQIVPIWKKEILEDGEVWIEGDERIARALPPGSVPPSSHEKERS